MSFLAIDVGNSNIVIGLFDQERLIDHRRLETIPWLSGSDYNSYALGCVAGRPVREIAIASVVPALRPAMLAMCRESFGIEPLEISARLKTGVTVLYDDPGSLGADRIANVAAAYRRWGGPAIVVDAGTATKFEAISPEGHYLGGAIAPGIRISAEALFRRSAALPEVALAAPSELIGRNTAACMQSGVVYGFVGLVEGMVKRYRDALGASAAVIATGGLSGLIGDQTRCFNHLDPFLTLDGIRIIHGLNR